MRRSRNRKVELIPAIVLPNHKNVAIYCRVSTPYEIQEGSLDNQKNGLSEKVRNNPDWTLVRIYEDVQSGANTFRPEFERMMRDAYDHNFDLIFVKSVSRLSRNTADLITTINKLHALGIAVQFDKENIMSTDNKMQFLLEINGAFAQWESQAISENIKPGLEHLKKRKVRII